MVLFKKFHSNSGLTLLELLVVITIIGLLASVFVISVGTWRAKSRDTQRVTDIRAIQQALAFYYFQGEYSGLYPDYDGHLDVSPNPVSSVILANNFMSEVPVDPIFTDTRQYYYCSKESGCSQGGGTGLDDETSYILMYYLERGTAGHGAGPATVRP